MRRTYIHKEGWKIVLTTFFIVLAINLITNFILHAGKTMSWIVFGLTFSFFCFVTYFFRNPKRNLITDDDKIICPDDGKIVVIEEVYEPEYFEDKRLQVSVFMSPANVHVNRNPLSADVIYSQYQKGKFLVAWHPKSSTENERHSVVYRKGDTEILVKQIAGAVARRIVNYLQPGMQVRQNEEMGFIKFGSRVDILLPVGTRVNVTLGQAVQGGVTVLATL